MDRTPHQQGRLLELLEGPLTPHLVPTAFFGLEELSQPYAFELTVLAKNPKLMLDDFIESPLGFKINDKDGPRYFHGYIAKVKGSAANGYGLREFNLTLRPSFWFLTNSSDCRIFQNRTVVEIIKDYCSEISLVDIDFSAIKNIYPKKSFCVQYNESVFNFISRLLEEAGIFYYFKQEKNKHSLMLTDQVHLLAQYKQAVVHSNFKQDEKHLHVWWHKHSMYSNQVATSDYDFKQPIARLETCLALRDMPPIMGVDLFEDYHYPGDYKHLSIGQKMVSQNLALHRWQAEQISLSGNYPEFSPGLRFQLTEHEDKSQCGQYYLTRVKHVAYDKSHLNELIGTKADKTSNKPMDLFAQDNKMVALDDDWALASAEQPFQNDYREQTSRDNKFKPPGASDLEISRHSRGGGNPKTSTPHAWIPAFAGMTEQDDSSNGIEQHVQHYHNKAKCVSSLCRFIPLPRQTKPVAYGFQSAIVTGPKGKDIYTDNYGRIKVYFPWDHTGKQDENSSCWIRVAQPLVGANTGLHFLPRVGQEVMIEFINGDMDQPICTGALYNGDNHPPYQLPEEQHIQGIKTRTIGSTNPEDANEIQFNDKPHKEKLYLQAQKDLQIQVKHNETLNIGNNYQREIKGNQSTQVQGGVTIQARKYIEFKAGSGLLRIEPDEIIIKGANVKMGEVGSLPSSAMPMSSQNIKHSWVECLNWHAAKPKAIAEQNYRWYYGKTHSLEAQTNHAGFGPLAHPVQSSVTKLTVNQTELIKVADKVIGYPADTVGISTDELKPAQESRQVFGQTMKASDKLVKAYALHPPIIVNLREDAEPIPAQGSTLLNDYARQTLSHAYSYHVDPTLLSCRSNKLRFD